MAKLNMKTLVPSAGQLVESPAGPGENTPVSFTPQPLAAERKPRSAKSKTVSTSGSTSPRIKGKEWFDANFAGGVENVVGRRVYNKRGGFKCAPCGISGAISYLIVGKDGRGDPLEVHDPKTMQVIGTIVGFQVGATCLKKYGGVDVNDIKPSQPVASQLAENTQAA